MSDKKYLQQKLRTKSLSLKHEVVVNKYERHYTLATGSGATYDIKLCRTPNCSCRYCNDREVCSHIIWLILTRFNVSEENSVLQQRGCTCHKLETIFNGQQKAPDDLPQVAKQTSDESTCSSSVTRHVLNTKPRCATCHSETSSGVLKITCDPRWTPPHKTKDGKSFTVPRKFHFCLNIQCITGDPPSGSTNIKAPSQLDVDSNVEFSQEEWEMITRRDIPLSFEN